MGNYVYIVRSVFTNDNISNPAFSNTVYQSVITEESDISELPFATYLYPNYPNPFNPSTNISFNLSEEGNITIDIFNIKGQKIKNMVNDKLGVGKHTVTWDGTDNNGNHLSSGIYLYQMKTDTYISMRKMLLLK